MKIEGGKAWIYKNANDCLLLTINPSTVFGNPRRGEVRFFTLNDLAARDAANVEVVRGDTIDEIAALPWLSGEQAETILAMKKP